MSGTHDGAPIDPLAALRAADHRPLSVLWRERVYEAVAGGAQRLIRRTGALLLFVLFAVAIIWRLFTTSQPAVEDSIPLADRSIAAVTVEAPSPTTAPNAEAETAPTPKTLVVHVAGAVKRPGLVTGEAGWRVDDAIRAAGGPQGTADLDRLNLAAEIGDGERIFVPRFGEDVPTVLNPSGASGQTGAVEVGPIDINQADATALETLPGIGPATAATIVAHREEHGSFGNVDALVAVRGIGPATLERLRDDVVAG
jgi:competence protein ComEA